MRITIINQFYVPDISPTAHLSESLAEDRAERGDTVTVVASRGGYVPGSDAARSERGEGNPRVYRVWTPQLGKGNILKRCIDYLSFYMFALWRMIRLPQQDVIITLTTPPFIAWAAIAHRLLHPRTKIVLWCMDCYPEVAEHADKLKANGFAARFMRMMNRAIFRRINHLVCLDTAMVELLMNQYAPPQTALPVSVIPNWERSRFFVDNLPQNEWEDDAILERNGSFIVLYMGNMGYGHEFETILDAAKRLQPEPIQFLFVGGGARRDAIQQYAADHQLDNVITRDYLPKKTDTLKVMAMAGCALITLRDDMLGVMSPSKLHSNLAMGLPVIYVGPRKSNVDDAISRFNCGVTIAHGNVEGLVAAIKNLASDEQLHAQMRKRAREAFDCAYCDLQTLPQFNEVIASLNIT